MCSFLVSSCKYGVKSVEKHLSTIVGKVMSCNCRKTLVNNCRQSFQVFFLWFLYKRNRAMYIKNRSLRFSSWYQSPREFFWVLVFSFSSSSSRHCGIAFLFQPSLLKYQLVFIPSGISFSFPSVFLSLHRCFSCLFCALFYSVSRNQNRAFFSLLFSLHCSLSKPSSLPCFFF